MFKSVMPSDYPAEIPPIQLTTKVSYNSDESSITAGRVHNRESHFFAEAIGDARVATSRGVYGSGGFIHTSEIFETPKASSVIW